MTEIVKLLTGGTTAGAFLSIHLGKYTLLIFSNMPLAIETHSHVKGHPERALLEVKIISQTGGDPSREAFIKVLTNYANKHNVEITHITPKDLTEQFITAMGHAVTELTKERML